MILGTPGHYFAVVILEASFTAKSCPLYFLSKFVSVSSVKVLKTHKKQFETHRLECESRISSTNRGNQTYSVTNRATYSFILNNTTIGEENRIYELLPRFTLTNHGFRTTFQGLCVLTEKKVWSLVCQYYYTNG